MSLTLPMFPLELVLYPGESLNLHIFEPKYKDLINDTRDQNSNFGIPVFQKGKSLNYGTSAKISKIVNEYSDGRLDIKTEGIQAFRIISYQKVVESKLYSAAEIEYIDLDKTPDISTNVKIIPLIEELYQYMNIDKEIPSADTELFSFIIAHQIGLSINQELELLSIESEYERESFLHDHLLHLIPVVKEMEALRKKVEMNGHFKNIIPPEIDSY